MQYTLRDKTLALAGIFQAARLVQQVARTGLVEQDVFEASINSILKVDADTPEDIYGTAQNLSYGCKVLLSQLGASDDTDSQAKPRDIEVTKYVISIVVLERKLSKRPDLLNKISAGIDKANSQKEHFSLTHDNVIASLADTYSETISTLKPKILVNGEQNHLANTENANKIRTLLLSAIRSAVLWRQCGGSRWQLLLQRKVFIEEAQKILQQTAPTIH